jgi:hypothetical protein
MKTKQQLDSSEAAKVAAAAAQAAQPETDFSATHRDEFAGQGGEYTIRDGKRVLVHRTRTTPARVGGRRAGDPAE